jgi:hypothetical protein
MHGQLTRPQTPTPPSTQPTTVVLEHDSKVSQLQLVCSASSLQVSVVQKMNSQEFKWITQMRGTPLPNQPDLYYFRCVRFFWRGFVFSGLDRSRSRLLAWKRLAPFAIQLN